MTQFGLNSWTTGDGVDALTDVRVAAEAGFQLLELRDWKIDQFLAKGGRLKDLRARGKQSGVGVLSVNTLDDSTLHSGDRLVQLVERCDTLCSWAETLECPYVIVGPSYLPDGTTQRDDIAGPTLTALRRYVDTAAGHSVKIAFEFHGYSRCSINNLAAAAEILEAIDDDRLGLVIDAFHFYVGGSRLEDLERLDPSRFFIVHLADADHGDRSRLGKPNRVFPGDGVLPLRDLVQSLGRVGYQGPYSLELFRPEYWAMDPAIVAQRGLSSMRRFV